MKNPNKKYMLIAFVVILFFVFGVFQLSFLGQEKKPDTINGDSFKVWDAETVSFKEYVSYDEMEKELEREKEEKLRAYSNVIKGTVVEQIQNTFVPSYFDDDSLVRLQQGELEVRSPKSDDFSNGIFEFKASLEKNTNSFVIGDFNKDGLDDVAHIIGYTGGGSGYFYNLIVFINKQGELKYLTHKELGDRVVIKSVKYDVGEFIVDIITQGEGNNFMGYCCPNVPKTIKFKLENTKLVEI